MALTKYKIGELVFLIDERNSSGLRNFYGINIDKEFMPTVAAIDSLDESNYKVVRKNRFVFSGMQTGRDKCIRLGLYSNEDPIIISPAYLTFEITSTQIILPQYLFMLFLSKEKDRLGWFYSDGSIRSNLDWDVFCDIELNLPPIEIQQKYVNIYNAMVANQKAYEKGLDDLKLVCDGYIEDLRCKIPCEKIGSYIEQSDLRNENNLPIDNVRGITTAKTFIATKADMDGVELHNYKIVPPNYFAYVPDTSRRGDKVSLALNKSNETYLVSSISLVFKTNVEKLLPEFLMLFLARNEFDRYARFNSWGSARETFDWLEMCNVTIPIPDIKIQQSIVDIYNQYIIRKEINEKMKSQIKDLCPILIKGSLEEGVAYDK